MKLKELLELHRFKDSSYIHLCRRVSECEDIICGTHMFGEFKVCSLEHTAVDEQGSGYLVPFYDNEVIAFGVGTFINSPCLEIVIELKIK